MDYCPNCKSALESGRLLKNSNELAKKETIAFINAFTDEKETAYCGNCVRTYLRKAVHNYKSMEKESIKTEEDFVNSFPLLTIENPANWKYDILGLVSFSRSVKSDYDARKEGEAICFLELKFETYNLGGNAIIGTRIGYSLRKHEDLGGSSQIISVYGTAINVLNTELFPDIYKTTKNRNMDFFAPRELLEKYRSVYKTIIS